MSIDGQTMTVEGPAKVDGATLTGNGWTLTIASGWIAKPSERDGSFEVVRKN